MIYTERYTGVAFARHLVRVRSGVGPRISTFGVVRYFASDRDECDRLGDRARITGHGDVVRRHQRNSVHVRTARPYGASGNCDRVRHITAGETCEGEAGTGVLARDLSGEAQ